MKLLPAIATLCAMTVLAGCAPTQQQFLAMQETVRGSAKARQLALESCMKDARPGDIKAAAIVIDSSEKAAPRLVCSRLIEALRSGRMTYADLVDLKQGRPTPKLIRIIQGR
ncbi:hypothetical protein BTR14_10940 [Rhizobium rhizosphaerae]|uniref:Uncharacterized protein n=2 Tax=Xaviernesmea rhizosphaerae TaxID=1672749 RepID=A0ABX3PET7_9HYPH|nr:hypothetical protein BTR14_10940 [Xaviernesmea rhizosphaerae]